MSNYLVHALLLAPLTVGAPGWGQVLTSEEARAIFTREEARAREARVARAYADVNQGDSKARVLEIAGEPATITSATETEDEIWIYLSGHYMDVSIAFKDGKVTSKVQRFINIKEPPVAEPWRF